jgi:hypothetical protein
MSVHQIAATTITVFLALSGWWFSYWLAVRKDRLAKKRDLRTQYLLDAYRRLESASNRIMSSEDERALESAIADIQLLGSDAQVRLATEFAQKFASEKSATLDQVLESLRRDLRKELNLGAASERVVHLRIGGGLDTPRSNTN